ncbi:MAG: 1-deoxy-D-xylulose-5-phosphate synthase [Clostridia bacterium]|nr:1-deoxy-D-xylulose-5-phosphate synthase [Clostridia bacterium]
MYEFIDKIESPNDIKNLNENQLEKLCREIRECLINTVSDCGGHLASNLGVVELTVALHRTLDAPNDKIVWDVGHQSYVHKILTGRLNRLNTLRSDGGLSGFCSPEESEYDVCQTGHSSTSVSMALGLAQAREIRGKDYKVCAVIGDGAFTGGLAFEAINNAGASKTKMMIILNDNEMSIDENVGSFSKFLAKARTSQKYTASKKKVSMALLKYQHGGKTAVNFIHNIKNRIKNFVAPNLFFEELGITYLGPVDGHSIKDMEELFERAVNYDGPVMVHVLTKKGRGYLPAEESPQKYHGVAPFERESGLKAESSNSYSKVFGNALCTIAEKNKRVAAITPAMQSGSGLSTFANKFPERFYDVGIAESHAVTFAAGLARGKIIPVVSVYSSFLQRGYDNVIHDVCIDNNHVVFAIDRAGLVPHDGVTHQGVFDVSYLGAIPNMKILAPSSYFELEKMLEYALNEQKGPIAIRYPRGKEEMSISNGDFTLSKASIVKKGKNITLVGTGSAVALCCDAADILAENGISAEVIDVRTIKPLDFDTIFGSAKKTGVVISVEENIRRGGVGEIIACEAKLRNIDVKIEIKAVEDEFIQHASLNSLREKFGFLPEQIASDAERMLKE